MTLLFELDPQIKAKSWITKFVSSRLDYVFVNNFVGKNIKLAQ